MLYGMEILVLLSNGADVAIKDNNGDTAADYYWRSGRSYRKDNDFIKRLGRNAVS